MEKMGLEQIVQVVTYMASLGKHFSSKKTITDGTFGNFEHWTFNEKGQYDPKYSDFYEKVQKSYNLLFETDHEIKYSDAALRRKIKQIRSLKGIRIPETEDKRMYWGEIKRNREVLNKALTEINLLQDLDIIQEDLYASLRDHIERELWRTKQ